MFSITQKNKYALKAMYELAKRIGEGPVKIAEISETQGIPPKFLESILAELKKSKIIDSKRGYYGGYVFSKSPSEVSVGDIIRFLEKQPGEKDCIACDKKIKSCPYVDNCAFYPLWRKVHNAIFKIYDETTLQDLLNYKNTDSIFKLE